MLKRIAQLPTRKSGLNSITKIKCNQQRYYNNLNNKTRRGVTISSTLDCSIKRQQQPFSTSSVVQLNKNEILKSSIGKEEEEDGDNYNEDNVGGLSITERLANLGDLITEIDSRIPYMLHHSNTASPVSSRQKLSPNVVLRLFPDSSKFYETKVYKDVNEGIEEEGEGTNEQQIQQQSENETKEEDGKQQSSKVIKPFRERSVDHVETQLHLRIPLPSIIPRSLLNFEPKGYFNFQNNNDDDSNNNNKQLYLSIPIPQIIRGRVAYTAAIRLLQFLATTLYVPSASKIHIISSHYEGPNGEILGTGSFMEVYKGGDNSVSPNKSSPIFHKETHQVVPTKYVVKWRTCSSGWCNHLDETTTTSSSTNEGTSDTNTTTNIMATNIKDGEEKRGNSSPSTINIQQYNNDNNTIKTTEPLSANNLIDMLIQNHGECLPKLLSPSFVTSSDIKSNDVVFDLINEQYYYQHQQKQLSQQISEDHKEDGVIKANNNNKKYPLSSSSFSSSSSSSSSNYLMGIFEFEFNYDCTQISIHTIQDVESIKNVQVEEESANSDQILPSF